MKQTITVACLLVFVGFGDLRQSEINGTEESTLTLNNVFVAPPPPLPGKQEDDSTERFAAISENLLKIWNATEATTALSQDPVRGGSTVDETGGGVGYDQKLASVVFPANQLMEERVLTGFFSITCFGEVTRFPVVFNQATLEALVYFDRSWHSFDRWAKTEGEVVR